MDENTARAAATGGLPGLPHFAPKAKRVIYLFQSGAPSQLDLFDYKPALEKRRAIELPDSIRMGQRITTMTSGQKSFPIGSVAVQVCPAARAALGWASYCPKRRVVDSLCLIRSVRTEAINHDPAITFG